MQKMFTVSLYSILLFPNWEVPQNELILPLCLEGFLQSIKKKRKINNWITKEHYYFMVKFFSE